MKSSAKAGLAILGLTSAIAFAVPAAAQERAFYVGGSLGQSEFKDSCEGITSPTLSCDEKDTAWKIFGGYQFNRHFAAELGYGDFGETSLSGPGGSLEIGVTLWELVGVASFPIVDRLSVYAKLGLYRAETELKSTIPGLATDDTNTDFTFGFGVRYDITRNLGVRAEWQRYNDVAGDTSMEGEITALSIGVLWKF